MVQHLHAVVMKFIEFNSEISLIFHQSQIIDFAQNYFVNVFDNHAVRSRERILKRENFN